VQIFGQLAENDAVALEEAIHLRCALRLELWHGSRKVGDVPATMPQNHASNCT
jgi:hypothetical protein